ncbi:MAG: Do family serine endopeptidase [bacterium]|nr:Do family serine endopeptidase [bacterium]
MSYFSRTYFSLPVILLILLVLHFFPFSTFASGLSENLNESKTLTSQKLSAEEKKEAIDQLSVISKVFVEVAAEVKPAVVNINTETTISGNLPSNSDDPYFDFYFNPNQPRKSQGLGSGFIINNEGLILTNYHVIQDAKTISVRLSDQREFEAKLIGSDEQSDVALIKIEGENLPVAKLGDSDKVQVGEWVIAVGSPFSFEFTVTAGIISAMKRSGVTGARFENYIQTDAAINPGNSGGPLVNLNGEVIGINTAIVSRSGGFQGLGFAIPINFVKAIIPQLQDYGEVKHGVIGVAVQPLDKDLAKKYNIPENNGVIISEVYKDSPAEKEGLVKGDIILEVNSRKIDSVNSFIFEIGMILIGAKAEMKVFHEGQEKQVSVEVAPAESVIFQEAGKDSVTDKELGLTVSNITETLAKQYKISPGIKGVVIIELKSNSVAGKSELKEGNIITEINRKKINNVEDYKKEISKANIKNGILFLINKDNSSEYIILEQK